jgi:uncharacterized protein YuzE
MVPPLVLTKHLLARLAERKILLAWVERVVMSPDWTEKAPRDFEITGLFADQRGRGGKVLRVAYIDRPDGRHAFRPLRRETYPEARLMRVTYDPKADAMYLYLAERAPGTFEVARTEEVATGVMLDFNGENQVIGVEILCLEASRRQAHADGVRNPDVV